jgi:glycolate oxidase FAD binding subunit
VRNLALAELETLLPAERMALGDVNHPFGNQGAHIVYPETEEEIVSVLKVANGKGLKVIPVGGGTKQGFGGMGEKADLMLSLSRYKGVIEHTVGDMTMAVRAGTTMQEIADHLRQYEQMLPIDASWPEDATIGGVIAANDSGPKRMKYGSARDFVIGLRVVYPDGKVIRTGGKVVKNVAGYDMNKLFVGSMGTLGVISEVRVKLRPLPKYESLVLLHFQGHGTKEIRSFVSGLLNSTLEASSLELLTPGLAKELTRQHGWVLAISFEDREKAVHVQEDWVKNHQPERTEIDILRQQDAKAWWEHFSHIAPNGAGRFGISGPKTEIALKIGSKNLDVPDILKACEELKNNYGVTVKGHGGLGHGISRVIVKGDEEALLQYVEAVRRTAENKKGYAIVTHMPYALRQRCSVWGEKPVYFSLLEGIKQTIDPNRMLNPGRFVGGL